MEAAVAAAVAMAADSGVVEAAVAVEEEEVVALVEAMAARIACRMVKISSIVSI